MLIKTLEFLDAMCSSCFLSKNWILMTVDKYGSFVWNENDPNCVYKIYNSELWMEENKLVKETDDVNCPVRTLISKKAVISPMICQPIEIWVNIIVSQDAKDPPRVETYLDQGDALGDAEQELTNCFEVHTKRVVVKVP